MFDLAANSRNLVLVLNNLPDDALEMMVEWNNELVEASNAEYRAISAHR